MNLQLALDRLTREECLKLLAETHEYVDWIEIGTGVIKDYGMEIVREIKKAYPNKILVADMKTCDAGKHEALQAFEAGADITTVMAFSADKTITDTLEVAKDWNRRIMIDLLGVNERTKVEALKDLGVDLVSLHYGKDMQSEAEMDKDLFSLIKGISGVEVAVAGGINLDTLPAMIKENPDTVIIGSAITKAADPRGTIAKMKEMLNH